MTEFLLTAFEVTWFSLGAVFIADLTSQVCVLVEILRNPMYVPLYATCSVFDVRNSCGSYSGYLLHGAAQNTFTAGS